MPVLLTMLVTGCLKDDLNQETIVLLGTESEVQPIDSVIPDTLLNFIKDINPVLNLPGGNTPPDIQGEYLFTPIQLYKYNSDQILPQSDTLFIRFGGKVVYDSVPHTYHAQDVLIQGADTIVFQNDTTIYTVFTYYPDGQHNCIVPYELYGDVMEKDNKYEIKKDNAIVKGKYVEGADSGFTVYFIVDYECAQAGAEFTLTRGYIITGNVKPEGIENAVVACVNKKVTIKQSSPSIPDEALLSEENHIYVYRVQGNAMGPFGTAIRKEWVKP